MREQQYVYFTVGLLEICFSKATEEGEGTGYVKCG